MGLLTFIRKLLSRVSLPPKPASLYADYTKRTRSGKLRARASPGDWGERFGTDETIHQVEGISQSAKKVYRYLSAIADKDGHCFPFYKTIARRTSLSESTVWKALNDLEAAGLVTREQRVSRRGGSSNLYQVKRASHVRSDEPGTDEG